MEKKNKGKSSFINAFSGLVSAFRIEPNFIFHTIATVLVVIFAVVFSTSVAENLILIITVAVVISAEMFNTAIEKVVDLICVDVIKNELKKDEHNEIAKIAKDISAAAVLITAVMSVIIGCIIFLPKIIDFIKVFF